MDVNVLRMESSVRIKPVAVVRRLMSSLGDLTT